LGRGDSGVVFTISRPEENHSTRAKLSTQDLLVCGHDERRVPDFFLFPLSFSHFAYKLRLCEDLPCCKHSEMPAEISSGAQRWQGDRLSLKGI